MYRVEQFSLSNYGKIQCLNNIKCSNINVILGENSTGKTFLLKALYVAIKSQEDYLRGDDTNSLGDILAEKIKWTFQVERLGDLVTKNAKEPLEFSMTANKSKMEFRFTKDANRKIVKLSGGVSKEGNSIFIPAKEVLSLYSIILQSREINKVFGKNWFQNFPLFYIDDNFAKESNLYNLTSIFLNEQKKKDVGILFVGEDLDVMLALCDKILVLCHGEVMGVVHASKTTKEELGLMMTGPLDLKQEKEYGKAKDSNLTEEQWNEANAASEENEKEDQQ